MNKAITIDEAKEIAYTLQILILKITGSKKEDGSMNTPGLVEQLEDLYQRLSPTSINMVNNIHNRATQETLTRIDESLERQAYFFEEQNQRYEVLLSKHIQNINRETDNALRQKIESVHQPIRRSLEQLDKQIVLLEGKAELLKKHQIFTVLGMLIAFLVGVSIGMML